MDYQYNQQPQYPQQQMMYASVEEIRIHKKTAFEGMADKIAEFFNTNGFLRTVGRFSHIFSYIVSAVALVITVINAAVGGHPNNSVVFGFAALLFGFIALSKRTVLPLALALSEISAFTVLNIILTIVNMATSGGSSYFGYSYGGDTGTIVAGVFDLIFFAVELALLVLLTVIAWQTFGAMLDPKPYQPQPMYAQPVPQQYQQPAAPAPVAPAPAPVQPAPAPAPAQPAPAQAGVCPACGVANAPGSSFCKGCGTKL